MTIEELSAKYIDSPFMVDGYHVPSPHLGSWLHESIKVSKAFNNSRGDFIEVIKFQKDKFNWYYDPIKLNELRALDNYIKRKQDTGSNSFSITSWTPDRGYVTKLCSLGTPIQAIPKSHLNEDTGEGYIKYEYHWIQIKGHKSLMQG